MTDTYEERPPLILLADALALCEMATELPPAPHSHHASAARSAVIAAILALEATANSLIAGIDFPPRLMDLIDQASATEKFEFALFARDPKKTLDRGATHVQVLKELFEIRNRFVHPKPQEHGISHRNLGGGAIQIEKTGKPSAQLKLPASPEDWRVEHAIRVIKAAFAFLDYFLLDLCAWPDGDIGAFLLNRLVVPRRQLLLCGGVN